MIAVLITALLLNSIVPARHALHMFQQNRYEFGRYTGWLREHPAVVLKSSLRQILVLIICVILSVMKLADAGYLAIGGLCILTVWEILQETRTKYIKPLVLTDRVKRQIAVLIVLSVLIYVILLNAVKETWILWLCMFISGIGIWLLIYPMAALTLPIENAVKQWYLNDAKKILRSHTGLIIVGITGSYGKTSTKNIIQSVLSERFDSLMTPASYNTPMGITRTVREHLKPIHQVFVCEMGADHVGDITELMEFVRPQIGIMTSIGPQHLLTFGSQENITREKMQEIELLPADGCGILNYDNDLIRNYQVKNPVKIISYGIRCKEADYRAEDIVYSAHGSSFTLVHGEERYPMETKLLGELNILNILSAIACARYLEVPWPVITRAVKTTPQVEHRLEVKRINGRVFIDDAFNANPSGSRMALDVLSRMPGRRIIVTPGMIDLGEIQDKMNREFGAYMKDRCDEVILVGEHQVQPIYQGLQESGYDMNNVMVKDTVQEAFAHLWQTTDGSETILLENDLPDAFNH